jgi:hypothetical protein
MRFRRGQNRYNLPIFTVLFISLSLFIFLYLGLHFFIYYIFLSKPLTLVLIPTWLSTFFICFKRNFGKIKIERKTKEKAIFYSIFLTFLVFYFYFYHTPALIVAQTHYPNRCSSSSDCPSGQWCCGGSCTTPITCTIKTCNPYGACQYETLSGLYCPGSCPSNRCNTDADCAGGIGCSPASCNLNDGWYCEGDIRQYRDYFCFGNVCTYNVVNIYDCNSLDYTTSYCDGDTVVRSITDAYCRGGSCIVPPARTETYYCGDYCNGPKLVDNTCSNGQCVSRSITCSKVCGAQCENNNDCPSGYHCGPSCVCQSIPTTPPSCPPGTTCVDRVLCGRVGGSCVSSCGSYECCCSIPTTYTTTTTRTTTPTTTTSSTTTTRTTTFTTTYTTTTTRFTTTTSGGGGITTTTRFTTTPTPTPTTTGPSTTYTTTTFTTTITQTTRTTTPILTTTFVTTTRQFTTTPTPTTTTTITGRCINANGICEPGETQQGCPTDCKTIVSTPYKYTANYNPVNLTIQFNDSRIYYDEPIKLEIYFINSTHRIEWNGSDCPIFGKVFNRTNVTSIPNTNITYHINVPGLANAITVNTICRVPGFDKLAPGSYTILVKPTIYSPITLSQASTKINIYNNFLEYLLLVIRDFIFG